MKAMHFPSGEDGTAPERGQPQAIAVEQALIGAAIIDNEVVDRVGALVRPEDFYRERHRLIWAKIVELHDLQRPVDLVTLGGAFGDQVKEVGGIAYLSQLPDRVPVTTNAPSYARLIREKARLRRLLEAAEEIRARVLEGASWEDSANVAEASIFAATGEELDEKPVPMAELLGPVLEQLEQASASQSDVTGLATGFVDLDLLLSGLQPANLIVLAARPSMGKTALALDIAREAALQGMPVLIFSYEMTKEELAKRLLLSQAMVDGGRARVGRLVDAEWNQVIRATEKLYEAPIYIHDSGRPDLSVVRSHARRMVKERGVRLLVVDYLQLMEAADAESREREIAEISRGLKLLAKELKIPVLALSQLNRDLEKRQDKRPVMADIRESGAVEQDADVILFLYRDYVYRRRLDEEYENEELMRKAEVIIAKQRNGVTGTVDLVWLAEYCTFRSVNRWKS